MRAHRASAVVLAAAFAVGCGGSGSVRPKPSAGRPPARAAEPDPYPPLPAHVVAELESEGATLQIARRGDDALLVVGARGRLRSQRLGPDGAARGASVDVAPLPAHVPFASLVAVGSGYLFAWAEQVEKTQAVRVLALDAAGRPAGAPTFVTQSTEELAWLQLVPNASGALLLWEMPRGEHGERAEIVGVPIKDGKPSGAPTIVLSGALGWEALATSTGAAIAYVTGDAATRATSAASPKRAAPPADKAAAKRDQPTKRGLGLPPRLGRVELIEVDARAKASAPVVVSAEPTAQLDVAIADIDGAYALAWTDERDIDASVFVAGVAHGGKVLSAAHPATAPSGEQALVSLVASSGPGMSIHPKHGVLAWEDLLRSPRRPRHIHLAAIGSDATVGKERATIVFAANGRPDIALDDDGFAALTLAPIAMGETPPARGAPTWPTFVRFGPDFSVRASEPVRAIPFAASEGVPSLTRDLSCAAGRCVTFASGSGSPTPLAAIELPVRKSTWRAPAWREADDALPRAATIRALFDGEHLSDVTAAKLDDGSTLVAWVTYFVEGASGSKKGAGATSAVVGVRSIASSGSPAKPIAIADHAVSSGGVALAAASGGKTREAALAWVGREGGEAQVIVTKLGADGSKIAQKALTTVSRKAPKPEPKPAKNAKAAFALPSEPSDVAIAYAPDAQGSDGWIVAWVDTRDQNAEIYVAKIDRTLKKVVADQRITNAPGDSVEVQIAVRGKETWLVWSDARENPDTGIGDIYLARLETASLKKLGDETRLFASNAHSRSPALAPIATGGVLAAWIEEAAGAAKQAGGFGMRIGQLDDHGVLVGSPLLLQGNGGANVTSFALGCEAKRCRGVVTSALATSLELDSFELAVGSAPTALKPLATLTGGVTQDVTPTFSTTAADALFFTDDSIAGTGRLRWMTIAWPP